MSAWIQPVFDRENENARMRVADMNRITGNVDYLYTALQQAGYTVEGQTISKTSWQQNDIITVEEWAELLQCIAHLCDAVGYSPTYTLTMSMNYNNINNVELMIFTVHQLKDGWQQFTPIDHFTGDAIYAGDEANAGGYHE